MIFYFSGLVLPFDGVKATSRNFFDESATSSNMPAVPPPTTATFTFGVPADLNDQKLVQVHQPIIITQMRKCRKVPVAIPIKQKVAVLRTLTLLEH